MLWQNKPKVKSENRREFFGEDGNDSLDECIEWLLFINCTKNDKLHFGNCLKSLSVSRKHIIIWLMVDVNLHISTLEHDADMIYQNN